MHRPFVELEQKVISVCEIVTLRTKHSKISHEIRNRGALAMVRSKKSHESLRRNRLHHIIHQNWRFARGSSVADLAVGLYMRTVDSESCNLVLQHNLSSQRDRSAESKSDGKTCNEETSGDSKNTSAKCDFLMPEVAHLHLHFCDERGSVAYSLSNYQFSWHGQEESSDNVETCDD
jgi:hypothetical protein